jgi:hypothetical protein
MKKRIVEYAWTKNTERRKQEFKSKNTRRHVTREYSYRNISSSLKAGGWGEGGKVKNVVNGINVKNSDTNEEEIFILSHSLARFT